MVRMSTIDASKLMQVTVAPEERHIPRELQQLELNDNLAILRVLDNPPYDEFSPFASEPVAATNKQKRQTFLNFLAFCLAESRQEPVAIGTTMYALEPRQHDRYTNQLVLYIAGVKDQIRARYLFSIAKKAWRSPNPIIHHGSILEYVMRLTEPRLKRRLEKLQSVVRELSDFGYAVDQWGKQEPSTSIRSWGREEDTSSDCLKACFEQLRIFARGHNFDEPYLVANPNARIRIYQQWLIPACALTTTQFLCEMDAFHWNMPNKLLRLLRLLRRRCFKIRWYDLGVTLLCSFARDCVWRILGYASFDEFLRSNDDEFSKGPFRIEFIDPVEFPNPMPRLHATVQDMVQNILRDIDGVEDNGEERDDVPYACDITEKPYAQAYWTPTCTPRYHVELLIADHLMWRGLRASPSYIASSQLTCRVCQWYVERLTYCRFTLHTGMLVTGDLEVPADWLIPFTDTGTFVAELVGEEAAKLVLEEERLQRAAWEKEFEAEIQMGLSN